MAVFYRKYRPQIFGQVVGQRPIIQTLKNQVATGQVAHAYLFVGSRGVGKTSVARILAKALNCQVGEKRNAGSEKFSKDACGECDICQAVQNGSFIDLIEIDAASNTGVDNVRELIEHVKFSPGIGKYKIFIIDEVHMLSKGAFNALLKTLEEPPPHAIFILATTEAGKLPATIISRTQRFDFARLTVAEVEGYLQSVVAQEKLQLPGEVLRLIALHSEGALRDALSLLEKISTLGPAPNLEEVLELIGLTDTGYLEKLLDIIAKGHAYLLPDFFRQLLDQGVDFSVFNRDFLEYLRQILIIKIAGQPISINLDEARLSAALKLSSVFTEDEIIFITRSFFRSLKEQAIAPAPDLPLLLAATEAAVRRGQQDGRTDKTAVGPSVKIIPATVFKEKSLAETSILPKPELATGALPQALAPKESAMTEITKDLAAEPKSSKTISFKLIEDSWPTVVSQLKEINGQLAHLLKTFPVHKVAADVIVLGVNYQFHKQNLEYPKNQEIISKVLSQVYGQNLRLAAEVVQKPEVVHAASSFKDALQVFGGELVD